MTNAKRTWQAVAAAVMAVAATATVAAAGDVRALQPRGARLLEEGMRRTAAMRELVDDLRKTDVVVYVDLDPNEPGASRATSGSAAPPPARATSACGSSRGAATRR